MSQLRDCYQRKIYAVLRMDRALSRSRQSQTKAEEVNAEAWAAASGIRHFKIVQIVRE